MRHSGFDRVARAPVLSGARPAKNQLRSCRHPIWREPWFRSSCYAVAKPWRRLQAPPQSHFWPGCPLQKAPLQGLGHGRVNDVSKCVKRASLNPSVPVVK